MHTIIEVCYIGLLYNFFQATVAYHLLLDHQLRDSNGYLGAEIQETTVCLSFPCLLYSEKNVVDILIYVGKELFQVDSSF